MTTFGEYQKAAAAVPVSLRNDRDRIDFPVQGLQAEAGNIGSLLAKAFASGKFHLKEAQSKEIKDRLADVLWYVARLCTETGIGMQELAAHSITQLDVRARGLNPDQR